MSTYRLDLLFLALPKEAHPGPAISHVYLKRPLCVKYEGVPEDVRVISSQCMSFNELAAQIEQLQSELNEIRAKAKKKYAAYYRLQKLRFDKRKPHSS